MPGDEDLDSATCRKCRNQLVSVVDSNAKQVGCLFPLAVVDIAGREKQQTRVSTHNSCIEFTHI